MSGQIAVFRRAARGGELVRTRRAEDGGAGKGGIDRSGRRKLKHRNITVVVWRRHLGPQTVKHVGDDVRTTDR